MPKAQFTHNGVLYEVRPPTVGDTMYKDVVTFTLNESDILSSSDKRYYPFNKFAEFITSVHVVTGNAPFEINPLAPVADIKAAFNAFMLMDGGLLEEWGEAVTRSKSMTGSETSPSPSPLPVTTVGTDDAASS